jgi:outer membrane lipoprotein-sorting protein
MNRIAAAMIAVGLAAGSPVAGCATAAKLSAAEIVARNVAARGGVDAWHKVETMVWIGHIESTHAPLPSMPFKLEQKRPNKARLEISAIGDKSVRVFNGQRGWKLRPARGWPTAQPYDSQELKFAQTGHGIDGPLMDYAAKGNSVTLEGVDQLAGSKAYHLKVHPATGGDEDVWVDTETYLDLRYDRMAEGLAGSQRRVSATYGDYRTVEGVKVPFLITTGGEPGTTPDKMALETVVLNAPLDDSTFENPAAARGRNRAPPSVASRAPATAASLEGGAAAP